MPDNPTTRRLITISSVVVLFAFVTLLSPLLALAALAVDATRSVIGDRPWVATRGLAFLWVYLLGEIWALIALAASWPLPKTARSRITFGLQGVWANWNVRALCRLFSITIEVDGAEKAKRGPIVILSRHASMVDTLLPAHLVANPFQVRLRYVLKRELLVDPALDVAGNRLPNYFIDRKSTDTGDEVAAIAALARDLGDDEGILIYPEGTRFSEAKRRRYVERLARRGGTLGELASGFRRVLPPRAAGTLAILEATTADVVVLAHVGLEGLATVRDMWAGGLVGATIQVAMWRVPRSTIPAERNDQVVWLFELWRAVDEWVVEHSPADHDPT
ncbi:MAG TPA: lysophospholipid acyltransferase family protein [Acidimicrobiia bacterium]|nr:lysophospholipid acyltransferase family protein [Acidimicrobiia bacterium]